MSAGLDEILRGIKLEGKLDGSILLYSDAPIVDTAKEGKLEFRKHLTFNKEKKTMRLCLFGASVLNEKSK